MHPVVETGFGLAILVRSLLSLLGQQVAAAPAQGETEEAMQIAAPRPRPCLPLPRRHDVLQVGQHAPAGLPHAPHPCRLGGPGTLGTQLSFHLVAGSGFLDLGASPWLPDYTNWLHCQRDPPMFTTHCLDASPCTRLVPPTDHAFTEGSSFTP